jgi:ribonuclease Z
MTTSVTLTGTGIPHPTPGRAGPGALVRHGDITLQFDAGRGTVMRLADTGVGPHELTALFVTHVHSDHLVGLADVAMTRWIQQQLHRTGPLTVYAVEGHAATFVRRMFDVYVDDIATRTEHVQSKPPEVDLNVFDATPEPTVVWTSPDGSVVVDAVAVHHEPVADAVAYRVTTPDGVIVISGDTRVCDEVEQFAAGADVLVHEACRATALRDAVAGTVFETIFSYHADTVPLGGLAERAGVRHLVLTHLIPSPATDQEEAGFEHDVRAGGYTGRLTVGRDLMSFEIGTASA